MAKKENHKKIAGKDHPVSRGKQFPISPVTNFGNQYPLWKFRKFDVIGSKEISEITGTCVEDVILKLGEFETMNWTQIESAGHGQDGCSNSHYIDPYIDFTALGLKKFKEKRLEEFAEDMFSLRLTGLCRLIGYRDGNILNIIWYDSDHGIVKSDIQARGKVKR